MTNRVPRTVLRVLLDTFCWTTALYAFITSSAFAYLQFIKPRVFHWLGWFSDAHVALSLGWLLLLFVYLYPRVRTPGRERQAAIALGAGAGLLVTIDAFGSVVSRLHAGSASIA